MTIRCTPVSDSTRRLPKRLGVVGVEVVEKAGVHLAAEDLATRNDMSAPNAGISLMSTAVSNTAARCGGEVQRREAVNVLSVEFAEAGAGKHVEELGDESS